MGYDSRLARFDGGFLCCINFEAVRNEDAWVDADGQAWDMCKECGDREQAYREAHTQVQD